MTHLFIHLKTLGCISSNPPALTWRLYPPQEVSCPYQEPATPAGHLHRRDDSVSQTQAGLRRLRRQRDFGHITSQWILQVNRIQFLKLETHVVNPWPLLNHTWWASCLKNLGEIFRSVTVKKLSFTHNQMSLSCNLSPYSKDINIFL